MGPAPVRVREEEEGRGKARRSKSCKFYSPPPPPRICSQQGNVIKIIKPCVFFLEALLNLCGSNTFSKLPFLTYVIL